MNVRSGAAIRDWIYNALPRPHPLGGSLSFGQARPERIVVFIKKPNASFSYYLEERLRQLDVPIFVRSLDERLDVEPRGTFVVVCRYATGRQIRWIRRHRLELAGVAYFIDDDLAAVCVQRESDWGYRFYVGYYGLWPLARLNRLLDQVWVSTEPLAQSLPVRSKAITVLPPLPEAVAGHRNRTGSGLKMVFHSTGSHSAEHEFLRPIVEQALGRHGDLSFEVVASGREARRWERVVCHGRISIIPAASWPDYVSTSSTRGADIALVPLLDGLVNTARSDTKRIDVARLGASAIFSKTSIYNRCACEGELHLPNDAQAWENAIDSLVRDQARREKAAEATVASVGKMQALGSAVQFGDLVGLKG